MKQYVINKIKQMFNGESLEITRYIHIMSDEAMVKKAEVWHKDHEYEYDDSNAAIEDYSELLDPDYEPHKNKFWLWGDGFLKSAKDIDTLINENFEKDVDNIYKYLDLNLFEDALKAYKKILDEAVKGEYLAIDNGGFGYRPGDCDGDIADQLGLLRAFDFYEFFEDINLEDKFRDGQHELFQKAKENLEQQI